MKYKPRRRIPPSVRFEKFINRTETCWLWTGAFFPGGYGAFWNGERLMRAHRFSFEVSRGPIPAGLDLDHLCRVRNCVRPDHLEPVTRTENLLRGQNEKVLIHRARVASGLCPKGMHDASRWNSRHHYCRGCVAAKATARQKRMEMAQ